LGGTGKGTTKPRQSGLKIVAWSFHGAFISGLSTVNPSKFIFGLYAVLFAGVTLWAVTFFLEMHRDYTTLRLQEEASRQRLTEAEARLDQQEKYLDQLRHDPALVERIVRQKLGYARPQEFIFRFEDTPDASRP
jgi:cell division protein FtsB